MKNVHRTFLCKISDINKVRKAFFTARLINVIAFNFMLQASSMPMQSNFYNNLIRVIIFNVGRFLINDLLNAGAANVNKTEATIKNCWYLS